MKEKVIKEIKLYKNEAKALHLMQFFKTGKGQYAEGDLFLGLQVPQTREISKKFFQDCDLKTLETLVQNPYHEIRLCSLLMMLMQYEKQIKNDRQSIFELYMRNTDHINNWDLVDLSAPKIIGHYTLEKPEILFSLAKQDHLWKQRIAIVSTLFHIKKKKYETAISLCEEFLTHKHDLIHKASGWMLREIGKNDIEKLYEFLDKHHKTMPRTMLRYSIEKLSEPRRKHYMKK